MRGRSVAKTREFLRRIGIHRRLVVSAVATVDRYGTVGIVRFGFGLGDLRFLFHSPSSQLAPNRCRNRQQIA